MPETTVKRLHHRVLAIETGSPRGSVAAAHAGREVHRPLGDDGQHGRLVTAALDEVAAAAGFGADTADLVVVVRGPGSFTGLRVGVALGKTLAWATGATLVGVSGFDLIARRVEAAPSGAAWPGSSGAVWIAFDAGRGELAVCRIHHGPSGRLAAVAATLWEPAALLSAIPGGDQLAGPGVARIAGLLAARPDIHVHPDPTWPTAAEGLRLGVERATAGHADDAAGLLPEYLRPSYVDEPRRQ
jgi:tRNA threonylcarbamoyladenosine biosynthesis protein TsaB